MFEKMNLTITRTITNILKNECQGKDNAKTVTEIARMVGIQKDSTDSTFGILRTTIKKIMATTMLPIASCHRGYFVIKTNKEYLEYQKNLDDRIAGIQDRKNLVVENWGLINNGKK